MLTIREFDPADAEGVSRLFRAVYGDTYTYFKIYVPSQIRASNASGNWRCAVAVEKGVVVGHAGLIRSSPDDDVAELALIAVHPDFRGQGIATQLACYLHRIALHTGLRALTIKQVASHPITQRMAATLGFLTTGIILDYVSSPFGRSEPESVVIGCLPIKACPLPRNCLPANHPNWLDRILKQFGEHIRNNSAIKPAADLRGYSIDVENADELIALPPQHVACLEIPVNIKLPTTVERFLSLGFINAGLLPIAGGDWYWLMQRINNRHSPDAIHLYSSDAAGLYADMQMEICRRAA
ncbi:GNAT family N-acetyltransferase [Brucella intermedia]|uniref:GNAT family N-acetyltransferase n=1 Tax=Brucella intermedia TaxID=94625 RepID=UPI001590291F|nr:GNAT family N-acetyltransferase [Brucella intermedia]